MLIYLVAVIVVAGVLGAGIVSLTTSSTFTQLSYNPSDQARYLAQAGADIYRATGNTGRYVIDAEHGKEIRIENTGNDNLEVEAVVYRDTYREARFKTYFYPERDGEIIIIDGEPQEFTPKANVEGKLEIPSGAGEQVYDEFDYYASDGIEIESGVELHSESAQGKVKLESDSGDINVEEGVVFSTTDSATNDPEEIYIKTCGNVDIQGAQFNARRYIYIEAGGFIDASDADLTVSTNSAQLGIDFVLNDDCEDIDTGNIDVENLYMDFENRNHQAEADPCEAIEGDLRDFSDNFDCP